MRKTGRERRGSEAEEGSGRRMNHAVDSSHVVRRVDGTAQPLLEHFTEEAELGFEAFALVLVKLRGVVEVEVVGVGVALKSVAHGLADALAKRLALRAEQGRRGAVGGSRVGLRGRVGIELVLFMLVEEEADESENALLLRVIETHSLLLERKVVCPGQRVPLCTQNQVQTTHEVLSQLRRHLLGQCGGHVMCLKPCLYASHSTHTGVVHTITSAASFSHGSISSNAIFLSFMLPSPTFTNSSAWAAATVRKPGLAAFVSKI